MQSSTRLVDNERVSDTLLILLIDRKLVRSRLFVACLFSFVALTRTDAAGSPTSTPLRPLLPLPPPPPLPSAPTPTVVPQLSHLLSVEDPGAGDMSKNIPHTMSACTVLLLRESQRSRRTGSVEVEVYRALRPETAGTDPPRIRVRRFHPLVPRQGTPRLADGLDQ